jgi:hypothetical protein
VEQFIFFSRLVELQLLLRVSTYCGKVQIFILDSSVLEGDKNLEISILY